MFMLITIIKHAIFVIKNKTFQRNEWHKCALESVKLCSTTINRDFLYFTNSRLLAFQNFVQAFLD